jgi:hypothetical protein
MCSESKTIMEAYIHLLEETCRMQKEETQALREKVANLEQLREEICDMLPASAPASAPTSAPASAPAAAPASATASPRSLCRIKTILPNQVSLPDRVEDILEASYDLVRILPDIEQPNVMCTGIQIKNINGKHPHVYENYPRLEVQEVPYLMCETSMRTVNQLPIYSTSIMIEVRLRDRKKCSHSRPELKFAGTTDEICLHLGHAKTTLVSSPRVMLIYTKRCGFYAAASKWVLATAENDPVTAVLADPSRDKVVADLIRSMPAEISVQSRVYDYGIPCLDVRLKSCTASCEPVL